MSNLSKTFAALRSYPRNSEAVSVSRKRKEISDAAITATPLARNKPEEPSIVVVGAGPIGLTAACALKLQGIPNVTILEQRPEFTRKQIITLTPESNQLLQKIHPPIVTNTYAKGYIDPITQEGYTTLSDFQQVLKDTATSFCGCTYIVAKATGVTQDENAVTMEEREDTVPFDVLVVADGAKSTMRDFLKIKVLDHSASGCGVVATLTNPSEKPMTLFARLQSGWLLRIFCTVDAAYVALGCGDASVDQFRKKMEKNWSRVVAVVNLLRGVVEGEPEPFDDKEFPLVSFRVRRAEKFLHSFSNGKSALIVGDAAHTTSFFSGSGANYGLKSIPSVCDFVRDRNREKFERVNEELFAELVSHASGFVPYLQDTRTGSSSLTSDHTPLP